MTAGSTWRTPEPAASTAPTASARSQALTAVSPTSAVATLRSSSRNRWASALADSHEAAQQRGRGSRCACAPLPDPAAGGRSAGGRTPSTYAAAMMNTKVVAVVLVAALVLTGVGTGLSVLLGR